MDRKYMRKFNEFSDIRLYVIRGVCVCTRAIRKFYRCRSLQQNSYAAATLILECWIYIWYWTPRGEIKNNSNGLKLRVEQWQNGEKKITEENCVNIHETYSLWHLFNNNDGSNSSQWKIIYERNKCLKAYFASSRWNIKKKKNTNNSSSSSNDNNNRPIATHSS